MHNLKSISPLGDAEPRVDEFAQLKIAENTDRSLASLTARQGQEVQCLEKASGSLDLDLPAPGGVAVGADHAALWIGPDSWLIDADHGRHETLAHDLKTAMGESASVVEQNDAWCRFDVSGQAACVVFERLCNVDIHAMQDGAVTRCSIHHIGCYLWCQKAGARFAVIGPRSSAKSLHHALVEIAATVAN